MRARSLFLSAIVLLAVLTGAVAGLASTTDGGRDVELRIEDLLLEPDGTSQMTVAVSGLPEGEQVTLDQLEVVENGAPVEGLTLTGTQEVEGGDAVVPAVVVVMDVSGSTDGAPIDAAKDAALALLSTVSENGARVGVVSFGEVTETLAPLSTDADAAIAAVGGLDAAGGTALYDGVSRAARMLAGHDGPRDIVVFSDGEDTTSGSGLDDVRALLAETEVRVTSVLLQTGGVIEAPLRAMALVNGGSFITVGAATELGGAFEAIAGDLTNRLRVVWTAEPVPAPERTLNIVASYRSGEAVASDGRQLPSPRLAEITPPRDVQPGAPIAPFLAGAQGQMIAAIATGVAVLLIVLLIAIGGNVRRRQAELDERLSAYQDGAVESGRSDRVTLSDRASSAFDVIPRPANLDSRIARAIEHADWPMRVSEFLLLTLAVAMLLFLVGAVVLVSWLAAALGVLLGLAAPWIYLRISIARRRSAFEEQLPTVLQILAGALRAGHALSTALDGAVDEVDEPARTELRRASVEARLGRPLDRALAGVAVRMDSEDLQWVISAIEVQREVGGNLAEILSNVAETLRDRSSVQQHVKSLTAEGRLSAVFISAMPFFLFVVLTVMNPGYMSLLFDRTIGRLMLVAGGILLLAGILVLRRLVRPRF